jgi:uncharacterized protein YpuA (DUF1002 family)
MADFDIKKIVSDLVEKFKGDPAKITELFKDPVKTVEKLLGIDLPDDKINKVVDGVKQKIADGDIKLPDNFKMDDLLKLGGDDNQGGDILNKVKGLFGS